MNEQDVVLTKREKKLLWAIALGAVRDVGSIYAYDLHLGDEDVNADCVRLYSLGFFRVYDPPHGGLQLTLIGREYL